jgi:parallel beta-helix repeat protein
MKKRNLAVVLIVITVLVLSTVIYGTQSLLNSPPASTPTLNPLQVTPSPTSTAAPSQNPTPSPSMAPSPTPSPSPSPEETFEVPALVPPAISLYVPDNYSSIQQAIDHAANGAAIFVRAGSYGAPVKVNKAVWLIGENSESTFLDVHSVAPNLLVTHDDVNVTGFYLVNTPTPATGSWLEQMQGIGLPQQLPDIQLKNVHNCNIYGNKITNSTIGVSLEKSGESNVFNNEFNGNGYNVQLSNSHSITVIGNMFVGGGTGISVQSSTGNTLANNTLRDMSVGIWMDSSSGNTLRSNKLSNNYFNFEVTGYNLAAYDNDVDASNTIEGKPIYYWIGRANQVVPSDGACVVLVNCTDMTVQNSQLSLGYGGLVLANTNNSLLQSNTLTAQDPALLSKYYTPGSPLDILLFQSHNNQVRGNTATVWLNASNNNLVTQNTGVIRLTSSNNNQISGNSIHKVAFVSMDWSGITLLNSASNLISGNTITDNSAGIWLSDGAKYNRVEGNVIDGNAQGGIVLNRQPMPLQQDWCGPESNVIINNTISDNGNEGLLDSAFNTTIIGNLFIKNSNYGLEISGAENCSIIGNIVEGIIFGGFGHNAYNCAIVGNNITVDAGFGDRDIWFSSESPSLVYHNNFLGAVSFDRAGNSTHVWSSGGEGNYWVGYTGTDANGDGIGDTPYIINEYNTDLYPLMHPYDITTAIPKIPLQ